jgi:hypothetical protein
MDVNIAACMKSAEYIGHTHYVNVCNGAVLDVSWGSADWAIVVFVALLGIGFIGVVTTLIRNA